MLYHFVHQNLVPLNQTPDSLILSLFSVDARRIVGKVDWNIDWLKPINWITELRYKGKEDNVQPSLPLEGELKVYN